MGTLTHTAALVAALLLVGCQASAPTPTRRAAASALEWPLTMVDGLPTLEVTVDGHPEAVRLETRAAADGPTATLGTLRVTLSQHHTLAPQRLVTSGAVVLDLPRKRLVLLDGPLATWLRWLDERAPNAQVESIPRRAGDGLTVSVFTGSTVAAQLEPGQARSSLGVDHVMLGTTVRAATLADATTPLVVGLDVLGDVVLVIPAGTAPVLLSFGAK